MKVAVFTTYNATPSNPNMFEFVEKNTNFLCDLYEEVSLIDISHSGCKNEYYEYLSNSIKNYNQTTKVSKIDINIESVFRDFMSENGINLQKLDKLAEYIALLSEYDCIYVFGNFVTFKLNNDPNKNRLGFNDMLKYNFDLSTPYYVNYLTLNEILKSVNVKKIQFFSDPLDIPFDGFKHCTPDTKNKGVFDEFLPIYQYYYTEVEKASKNISKPSNIFIMGNSCGDEYRKYLFDRYVLAFYDEHQFDAKYKFYASGYKNHEVVIDNYIKHTDFYKEIENSKMGLVLNTYSKNFISANKISMMLSRDCLPIITEGSDTLSEYIPSHIKNKITVGNSIQLEKMVEKLNRNDYYLKILKELKDFYVDDYLEIIKEVFLK